MQPSPAGTFFKFVIGFSVFIGLSLGITIAVNTYTTKQEAQQEAAAAEARILK